MAANSIPILFGVGFIVLLFVGVVILIKTIIVGLFNAIRGLFRFFEGSSAALQGVKKCTRWNCQCMNPAYARYCRRCGNEF